MIVRRLGKNINKYRLVRLGYVTKTSGLYSPATYRTVWHRTFSYVIRWVTCLVWVVSKTFETLSFLCDRVIVFNLPLKMGMIQNTVDLKNTSPRILMLAIHRWLRTLGPSLCSLALSRSWHRLNKYVSWNLKRSTVGKLVHVVSLSMATPPTWSLCIKWQACCSGHFQGKEAT